MREREQEATGRQARAARGALETRARSALLTWATMLVATAAALSVLGGCGRQPADAPEAAASAASAATALMHEGDAVAVPAGSPLRQALQFAPVALTTVEAPISLPSVIEADPSRLVKLVPPVGGRIQRLYKNLGDPVRAGEPLAVLDSADAAAAGSDAAKARAALQLADRNLARQRELTDAEIGARKDLEQAESDQSQAQTEARRAQARLTQLGTAGATGGSGELTLRAPISGHVIELNSAPGGFWNDTNAPLMTVADLSRVWLTANVPEKDLAAVFVGQAAHIVLNAYPDRPLRGRVASISQVLDPDTRSVKVRVALENTEGRLRPGMFASAVFSGASHEAVTVPSAALVQDGFKTRVFVERQPWTFESRVVETGAQIGSQVEIKAGLKPGERIVVKDGVLLKD